MNRNDFWDLVEMTKIKYNCTTQEACRFLGQHGNRKKKFMKKKENTKETEKQANININPNETFVIIDGQILVFRNNAWISLSTLAKLEKAQKTIDKVDTTTCYRQMLLDI